MKRDYGPAVWFATPVTIYLREEFLLKFFDHRSFGAAVHEGRSALRVVGRGESDSRNFTLEVVSTLPLSHACILRPRPHFPSGCKDNERLACYAELE